MFFSPKIVNFTNMECWINGPGLADNQIHCLFLHLACYKLWVNLPNNKKLPKTSKLYLFPSGKGKRKSTKNTFLSTNVPKHVICLIWWMTSVVNTFSTIFPIYLFIFVETPRKFIIAELSIRKLGSSSVLMIHCIIQQCY